MPMIQCPTCRSSLDTPAHLAGHAVACPSCHQQFQVPSTAPTMPVVETFTPAPSSSVTNRRSSRNESTIASLLLGILICNMILVAMVATWEIRWQYFAYNMRRQMDEIQQKAERDFKKAIRHASPLDTGE